jgi:hypothetical protein
MKIQPGQCKRCKAVIYLVREAGITWTADMTPLDAQTVIQALVGGREIYAVSLDGKQLKPAPGHLVKSWLSDGRTIVASHPCPTAVAGALLSAVEKAGREVVPGKGPGPSVPPKNRSSGPLRSSATAPTAEHPGSRPTCDGCSQPCADGTYASIDLGDLTVWAHHVDTCP